jgi:hypothetical protein
MDRQHIGQKNKGQTTIYKTYTYNLQKGNQFLPQ